MTPAATIVECPRDAFQGLPRVIPVERKVRHLRAIAAAGVQSIDFGSFVSPKAVPQMADSAEVLAAFVKSCRARAADTHRPASLPRLIAIIANERGLDDGLAAFASAQAVPAAALGYPLSVSDTFQRNNTRRSIEESWPLVRTLGERASAASVEFHVYLSMAFGNPYGDAWSPALIADFAQRVADFGVRTILLADTVGCATADAARTVFDAVMPRLRGRDIAFGAHFHAAPQAWAAPVQAAYDAGCRRFDTSLGGYGGCPFAQDKLVGNIPTEQVAAEFARRNVATGIDPTALASATASAQAIFEEFGHE